LIFFIFVLVEGIQYQSGSFPLIDVESGNCLRSFLHQSVTKLSKREGQPKKLCYFQTFGQEVLPERYAKACRYAKAWRNTKVRRYTKVWRYAKACKMGLAGSFKGSAACLQHFT
jgi:hypothetical protein